MNATGWAINIGNVLPWLIILIGCIVFAARMKSCVSWGLVFAAVGQFVMAVFWAMYRTFLYRELMEAMEFDLWRVVDISINVLAILAALFFAVMLLVVLLGKTRAPKAAPVPQPVAVPMPAPTPNPTQPVPPSGPTHAPPPPPQAESPAPGVPKHETLPSTPPPPPPGT